MRLIDADAIVYESIDSCDTGRYERYYGTGINAVRKEDIDEMPTIYPEPHWIPCSERLPEEYADVLVWFEYYRYGDYNCMYSTHGIGTYSKRYNSWMINHETGWRDLRVFAWMPLPSPYQPEEESE